MSQFFQVHPDNPQPRLIRGAAEIVRAGGVIVYPTDSSYALGCHIGDKKAMDRIRSIRRLGEEHDLTLVCRDLSELGIYAKVDNSAYRFMKALTPGPYTFLLRATREVPRRLQNPKRKTIGLRIPDNVIAQALLTDLAAPLMSTTLILPGEQAPLVDPQEMLDRLGRRVELIIDGGYGGVEPTTVIDLAEGHPRLVRIGKGQTAILADYVGD